MTRKVIKPDSLDLDASLDSPEKSIKSTLTSSISQDFASLHGTVKKSVEKVQNFRAYLSAMSPSIQQIQKSLPVKILKTPEVKPEKRVTDSLNADEVLKELNEYFQFEDTQNNSLSDFIESAVQHENFKNHEELSQASSENRDMSLENLSLTQLQAIVKKMHERVGKINAHLMQSLSSRDDESIKNELYQNIVQLLMQLEKKRSSSKSVSYVPRDPAFKRRNVIYLKKLTDLLQAVNQDSVEAPKLLAQYILQCSK